MKFGEYSTIKKLFLPKAQSGMFLNPNMFQQPNVGQIFQSQMYSQPQDTSVYNPYGWTPPADIDTSVFTQPTIQNNEGSYITLTDDEVMNPIMQDSSFFTNREQQERMAQNRQSNTYLNNYDEEGQVIDQNRQVRYNDRLNLINPYGGVDIASGFAYGALMAGQGKGAQSALGFSRGLFGLARVGANAYSKGREYRRGLNAQDNTFNPNYIPLAQRGGELTMADLFTNKYITDAPNPNIEIEEKEYTFNSENGMVQKAVGESHENGGIPTYLPPQSKVLSDFEKVGKVNSKELSKYLGVKVKPTDTYASALDKYSNKIGVKKNSKDEAELLEKTEKLISKDDNDTKDLNVKFLQREFVKVEEKKQELNTKQQEAFQELFNRQETAKGTINNTTPMFQQGGETQPQTPEEMFQHLLSQGMTEEEAIAYMEKQTAQPNNEIIEQVIQALQQGADPQEVIAYLVEQGIPQDQAIQVIEQVMQQGQSQQFMQSGGIVEDTRNGRQRPYVDGEQLKPWERLVRAYQEDGNIITLTDEELGRGVQQTEYNGRYPINQTTDPLNPLSSNTRGYRVGSLYEYPDLFTQQGTLEGGNRYGQLMDRYSTQALSEIQRIHPELYTEYFGSGETPTPSRVREFQEAVNNKYESILTDAVSLYGEDSNEVQNIRQEIEKDKFRGTGVEAVDSKLGNWTVTRPNYALNVLPQEDLKRVNEAGVNTAGQLKEKFPELYDQYIKGKGLSSDFWLGETMNTPETETDKTGVENNTQETVNRLRNVVPMLPNMFTMPPSAMQIPRQDQVDFNRITPVIRTPEAQIANINNQTNFAIEQAYANNPNLAPFLTANLLGTTQQSSNQAIAETDAYNAQAINQANLYNAQVGDKEQLMNINLNQNFEQRLFGTLANQEADWRRYFTNEQLQQRQNWQDVNNLNLMNQLYDNYQTDGSNMYFSNARAIGNSNNRGIGINPSYWNNLTPTQKQNLKRHNEAMGFDMSGYKI